MLATPEAGKGRWRPRRRWLRSPPPRRRPSISATTRREDPPRLPDDREQEAERRQAWIGAEAHAQEHAQPADGCSFTSSRPWALRGSAPPGARNMSAYVPPRATSSSCVPSSRTRALLDHDNATGGSHRGKPVRDQDRGQALGQLDEAVEELGLRADVLARGWLVEDEDSRPRFDRQVTSSERDPLPFAPRQIGAAAHTSKTAGVAAVGERLDDRSRAGLRRPPLRRASPSPRCSTEPKPHVLARGELVAHEVLEDDGDPVPPVGRSSSSTRSVSSTTIRPAVGRYRPASSLTSVVLPTPLGPTMARERPTGIDRSIPGRTSRSVPG